MSDPLLPLSDHDRERLGTVLRMLLARGSILGLEPQTAEIYRWAFQNPDLVSEAAALLGLEIRTEHEGRLIMAIPTDHEFLMGLKLDATLVLLVLWYEFDTAVRDRAEAQPIRITVRQLNDSLETKFKPLRRHLLAKNRLREILRLGERKNLLRIEPAAAYEDTGINILPTLKSVIPFQDIAEWTQHSERYLAAVRETSEEEEASDSDEP